MSFSSVDDPTSVNFKDIVLLLSDTADLVGFTDYHHSKRVAYMAQRCAQQLNFNQDFQQKLVGASLLHDVGVSSTLVHELLVTQLHWENADEHCTKGYHLLSNIPCLADYAYIILYHHTRWEELETQGLTKEEQQITNLIYLADRADALLYQYMHLHPSASLLQARGDVRLQLSKLTDYFCPSLMEAFQQVSAEDSFWQQLSDQSLSGFVEHLTFTQTVTVSWQDLLQLAQIISQLVTTKSQHNTSDCHAVANLCTYLASAAKLSSQQIIQLAIAGYLRDLGTLSIPDDILEKKERLTHHEQALLEGHSLTSQTVIERVNAIEEVAKWISYHHEYLDGSGYPQQLQGCELPFPARILTVADTFQSLVHERPYHKKMPLKDILSVLEKMSQQGKLDTQVTQLIQNHAQQCWQLASSQQQCLTL